MELDQVNSIENAKLSRSHLRIMLISGMSFFTDAYDLFVIGIVLIMIKGIFSLTPFQIGLLASSALFGAAVGPLIFGYVGDKIGRKHTYWITILILIIGAIGSAFSYGFITLFIWRFILGVGIGGDYPLSATIVAEYANKNDRGKLISSTFAMQGFGIVSGAILAILLLSINVNVGIAWRILLGFGAVPTLFILYARARLHETPWYSDYKKKASSSHHKAPDYTIGIRELISNNWKYIIGTSVAWFLLDISYYGTSIFTPYLTTLFGFKGIFGPTLASAAILVVAAVPGYWVAVALIDKEGRKLMQSIGFLAMGILFGILAISGQYLLSILPLAFFSLYALTFFFSNYGPNTTTYVYPVELYPTQYRARGHGIAATSGKIGAAISTLLFPIVILEYGKFALMGALGVVAIIGFVVTVFLLPETKRRSLTETSGEREIMLITDSLGSEFYGLVERIDEGIKLVDKRLSRETGNEEFFESVKLKEHEADQIVHKIMDYIADYGANSISYTDVSHLAKRLDDIMDSLEAIASRFSLYDVEKVEKEMVEVQKCTRMCFNQVREGMFILNKVRKHGMGVQESFKKHSILASEYENAADAVLRSSIKRLMRGNNIKHIIAYKEIYEHMEAVSDRCIDVIDIINDIIIKYVYSSKRS